MKDVFNKIIRTRPNTFVTFSGTAPVSSGFSPMTHATTSLSYRTGHFLPGSLSGMAQGTGSINFTGRLCKNPLNEGVASIEVILMPNPNAYQNLDETIISIPAGITVRRTVSDALNAAARYTIEGSGWSASLDTAASFGPEHIVVNINGATMSLTVNGIKVSVELPLGSFSADINAFSVFPKTGYLWGVVARPEPVGVEYIDEMISLIKAFPLVEEADAPFEGVSFYFDKSNLDYLAKITLDDVDFDDDPRGNRLYNGSTTALSDSGAPADDKATGSLNITDAELMEYVVAESVGLNPQIVGELDQEGVVDGKTDLSYSFASPITPLNKATKGDPLNVIATFTTEGEDSPVAMNMYMLPNPITMKCESDPSLIATISSTDTSLLSWSESPLLTGGLWGKAFIEPDPDAATAAEYPEAYGMWVLASRAGNLAKSTSFNVSLNASLVIARTGVSKTFVDGVLYSGAALTKGWHFIAFTPTTKNNDRIEVGDVGTLKNVINSFSYYLAATPDNYMASVYANYVAPPSIKSSTSDSMTISEGLSRTYAHNWSISAGD